MKQAQIPASVQRDLLLVRETSGDMLCLYAPGSPTRRSYRAVLEVAPINLVAQSGGRAGGHHRALRGAHPLALVSLAGAGAQPAPGPVALHRAPARSTGRRSALHAHLVCPGLQPG